MPSQREDPTVFGHILRGSAWSLVAVASAGLLGSVFWLGAARLYTERAVGTASALFTSVLFVNYATGMGLPVALGRHLRSKDDGGDTLYTWGLLYTTLTAAIGTIAYLAVVRSSSFSALWIWGRPAGYALFFVIAAGTSVGMLVDVRFIVARQWGWVVGRVIVVGLLRLPFLWLSTGTPGGFWLFMLGAGVPGLTGLFAAGILPIVLKEPLRLRPWPARARPVLRYATVNYAATLAAQAPQFALPVLVLTSVSAASNAHFFVAWSITALAFLGPATIGQVLLIEGSKSVADIASQARSAMKATVALMTVAAVLSVGLGRVVVLLYGHGYAEVGKLVPLLMLGAVPWSVTCIRLAEARVVHDHVATIAITGTFGLGVLIPAVILISHHGIAGAVAGWIIGNVAAAIVSLALGRRCGQRVAELTTDSVGTFIPTGEVAIGSVL